MRVRRAALRVKGTGAGAGFDVVVPCSEGVGKVGGWGKRGEEERGHYRYPLVLFYALDKSIVFVLSLSPTLQFNTLDNHDQQE